MKERVFYVINLDKQRMGVLALFFGALLFSFFFLGVSIGKGKSEFQNAEKISLASPSLEGTEEPSAKDTTEMIPLAEGPLNPVSDTTELTVNREEEEVSKKVQIIDLTKSAQNTKRELAMRNQSPLREIPLSKSELKKEESVKPIAHKQATEPNLAKKSKSNSFTYQLGSFSTKTAAESFSSQLRKRGIASKIVSKGTNFAVILGKSSDKDSLRKVLDDSKLLPNEKEKAFLISYPQSKN